MFRLGALVVAAVAVLSVAAPANAVVVTPYGGFAPGALSGITLGADGLLYVGEETLDKITRVSPSVPTTGYLQTGGAGGGGPAAIVTGAGVGGTRGSGTVWAAMTKAKEILRIDTFTGGVTRISTAGLSDCGPKGLAVGPGGAHMYFTLPNPGDGSCTAASKVGWVSSFTLSGAGAAEGFGPALDLDAAGGKLFVPDPAGGVVRRAAVDTTTGTPTIDGTFPVPGGGSPRGITATRDGSVWVTLWDAGKVARLHSAAADGTAPTVLDPGGPFAQPFGIVAGADGFVYAASYGSARIARFAPDGTPAVFPLPAGHSPWDLTNGPEGDLWITNRDHRTVSRFTHGAPRPTTRSFSSAATWAFVSGTTDPMGLETQTWFEWGKTAAYGNRAEVRSLRPSAPFVPAPFPATNPVVATGTPVAVGPVTVSGELRGLEPETEYHYRLVATNAEGTRFGDDETFETPKADDTGESARLPRLAARVTVTARRSGPLTRITRLRVTRLAGGESVNVKCKGRGCKFSSRTRSVKKKGTLRLESLFGGRALRPGARVVVRVTKTNMIGASASITARRSAKPKVVRRCLRPGAKIPTVC